MSLRAARQVSVQAQVKDLGLVRSVRRPPDFLRRALNANAKQQQDVMLLPLFVCNTTQRRHFSTSLCLLEPNHSKPPPADSSLVEPTDEGVNKATKAAPPDSTNATLAPPTTAGTAGGQKATTTTRTTTTHTPPTATTPQSPTTTTPSTTGTAGGQKDTFLNQTSILVGTLVAVISIPWIFFQWWMAREADRLKQQEKQQRQEEPSVALRMAAEASEERRREKADEAADPSLVLLQNEHLDLIAKCMAKESHGHFYVLGPKGIGKTCTIAKIPELLKERGIDSVAVFVEHVFDEKKTSVMETVYTELRGAAALKGYPDRPSGEKQRQYLEEAFKAARKENLKPVVLLDLQRPADKQWANSLTDEVRNLAQRGAYVFVTTSEGHGIAESKAEARRHIFQFTEVPWEQAEKYAKTVVEFAKKANPKFDMTDDQIKRFVASHRRDLTVINSLITRFSVVGVPKAFDLAADQATIAGRFHEQQCNEAKLLERLNNQPSVSDKEIQTLCPKEGAVKALVADNILRNIPKPDDDSGQGSYAYFTWQYDYLKNATMPAEK